jgi:peptidoglycan/xylan/chitin deacetylase (PgdA/CDA1 family)
MESICIGNTNKISPLVLHRIVKDANDPQWEDVSKYYFKEILNEIESSWRISGSKESINGNGGILTFDDGNSSDYEIVFPMLNLRKINAIFFLIVDKVGNKGYINWSQVKEMHKYGMIFGSHGLSHKAMSKLSEKDALNEFAKSKSILEDNLGSAINCFSYPFGDCSKESHVIGLSAGYNFLFTSNHGIANENSKILPRNSIHSGMNLKKISKIMSPGFSLQLRWKIEDKLKTSIKRSIGMDEYKKIRNKILHN